LIEERPHLQPIPIAWRGDITAARPQRADAQVGDQGDAQAAVVSARIATPLPAQHPLAVYEQLLAQWRTEQAVVQ
jgi:hypothetical protein